MWWASHDIPTPVISAMMSAPCPGVLKVFQNKNGSALGDNEAVAVTVEWSGCLFRRIVEGCGKGLHGAETPTLIMVRGASLPPVIIASARPSYGIHAVARAWVLEAQAVTVAKLGPLAPISMATCPAAMLLIIMGTKRELIRLGPLSRAMVCCSS